MFKDKDSKINILTIGKRPDIGADSIAANLILEKIMKENQGCLFQNFISGFTDTLLDEYIKKLEEKEGRKISQTFNKEGEKGGTVLYTWEHGMVDLLTTHSGTIQCNTYSMNEEFVLSIKKMVEETLTKPTKQGSIFAIMRNGQSLQITRIGFAGTTLERGNYSKQVLEDYDYVVKDLKNNAPSGRIIVLEGKPGTGKTYLIRSILMDIPNAMFVLVPPSMVSSLGGPELLPLLLRNKEDYQKTGPTVLILEDADDCLVPRQGDNMSSISSILNLGDGIFGSLFDIRILASTNAKKQQMDPAIIRAGRLSRRIEVDAMNYDEANGVFKRLLPNKDMPVIVDDKASGLRPVVKKEYFTLAEIYKAARDEGWEPPVTKSLDEEPIGFFEDYED